MGGGGGFKTGGGGANEDLFLPKGGQTKKKSFCKPPSPYLMTILAWSVSGALDRGSPMSLILINGNILCCYSQNSSVDRKQSQLLYVSYIGNILRK